MGIFGNIRSPFTPLESWFYDRCIVARLEHLSSRLLERLYPLIEKLPAESRILDVGCGGGQQTVFLSKQFPLLNFTGIDLSHGQIARAKSRGEGLRNVAFIEAAAEKLPFVDGHFDFVFSAGSIKHWSDRQMGVSECVRVLRPDRTMVMAEATRNYKNEDLKEMFDGMHLPKLAGRVMHTVLQKRVFNRSLGIDEIVNLLKKFTLIDIKTDHLEHMPVVLISARKHAAVASKTKLN